MVSILCMRVDECDAINSNSSMHHDVVEFCCFDVLSDSRGQDLACSLGHESPCKVMSDDPSSLHAIKKIAQ